MTVLECMEEFQTDEESLKRVAELAGIEWSEDFDYRQTMILTLAVRLQEYQFHEDQIRICCEDLLRLPEVFRWEIEANAKNSEKSQTLRDLLEIIEEDWDGSLENLDYILYAMEWFSEGPPVCAWGPIGWTPLIIFGVAVLTAFILRPVLKDVIEALLANFG